MVDEVAALRQTASMHAFRTPLSSPCVSLVCIEEYIPVRLRGGREEVKETHTIRVRGAQSAHAVAC
jgi:hypothetical protein